MGPESKIIKKKPETKLYETACYKNIRNKCSDTGQTLDRSQHTLKKPYCNYSIDFIYEFIRNRRPRV